MILIISLGLVSCGRDSGDNPQQDGNRRFETSDARFDSYKNDFTAGAANFSVLVDVSEVPVNFGDLDNIENRESSAHFAFKRKNSGETQTVGVCIEYSNGLKEVLLRESTWQNMSDATREILVFHELAHCEPTLQRDHLDSNYKGYDLSAMNSLLIDPSDYVRYYSEYLEELFTLDSSSLRNAIDNDELI